MKKLFLSMAAVLLSSMAFAQSYTPQFCRVFCYG